MRLAVHSSILMKMTGLVVLGTGAVLALVLGFSGFYSSDIILSDARTAAQDKAIAVASQMDQELGAVAKVAMSMAVAMECGQWNERSISTLLTDVVAKNGEIFGSTIAFEPYAFNTRVKAFAPYVCRDKHGLKFVQLARSSYDYFTKDWYSIPRSTKLASWSAPYFDEGGGNVLMTTYSYPFFQADPHGGEEKLRGVVTADMSLERLTGMVNAVKIAKTGYAFLISETGRSSLIPIDRSS